LKRKIEACFEMLSFSSWSRLPLKIHVLCPQHLTLDQISKPSHMSLSQGPINEIAHLFSNQPDQDSAENSFDDEDDGNEILHGECPPITYIDFSKFCCTICSKKFGENVSFLFI